MAAHLPDVDGHYGSRAVRAAASLHDDLERVLFAERAIVGARVIDVGAGTGAWARRLLASGAKHVTAVEWGRIESDVPGLASVQADLNRPGWSEGIGEADLVTCIEVVEHIPNQLVLLEGLRSLLAPKGRLVITTPNLETPRARLKLAVTGNLKEFDAHGDPTHYMPIFIYPFTKVCAMAGLGIDRIWGSPEGGAGSVGLKGRLADTAARLAGARYLGDNLCFLLSRR